MTSAVSTPDTPLTDRQELFVREYLVDLNASAAARRAGYSPKNNGKKSSEMLKDPRIRERIREGLEALYEKVGLNAITTLRGLVNVAFFDARKMVSRDGRVLGLHEMDEDTATTLVVTALPDKDGELQMRLRQPPRVAALITLLKRFDRERQFMQPWNEPEVTTAAPTALSAEEQQAMIERYDAQRAAWSRRPSAEPEVAAQIAPVAAQAEVQVGRPASVTAPAANVGATARPASPPGPEGQAGPGTPIAKAVRLRQPARADGPRVAEVEDREQLRQAETAMASAAQEKPISEAPAADSPGDKPRKRRPWGLLWGEMEGFFSRERAEVPPAAGPASPWEKVAGGPMPPGIVKERPRFAKGAGEFEWSDDYLARDPFEKA